MTASGRAWFVTDVSTVHPRGPIFQA